MRCNILRRPAFPGGNLKEKQFHIKLSDTMQVCGVEGGGGGGDGGGGLFRSFPNSHWPTGARHTHTHTHIPSAELKGMEWMKFQSLPLQTHTLLCTHQRRDVQIFNSVAPAWLHLLYAGIRHGSAVINENTKPRKKRLDMRVCVCVCAAEHFIPLP